MTDKSKVETPVKDLVPNMMYTRFMAFLAFFFALGYIWFVPEPVTAVLIFLGYIIGQWALGRATLIEIATIWKGK